MPASPVSTPGAWVPLSDFHGRKSFGYYVCSSASCGNKWVSAHAYPAYKQGCKRRGCQKYSLPTYMWKNDSNEPRDKKKEELINKKPHLRWLCEAGKAGVCDACANKRK